MTGGLCRSAHPSGARIETYFIAPKVDCLIVAPLTRAERGLKPHGPERAGKMMFVAPLTRAERGLKQE